MNPLDFLKSANAGRNIAIIGGVGIVLFVFLRGQVTDAAQAAVNKVTTINKNTPFENTGIVGTLGNITNQASGGILGRIGSAIGRGIADLQGI